MLRGKDHTIPLLGLLARIGIASLLFATRWGIGISPDSTTYVGAARNLLNGHGLGTLSGTGEVVPMTHYPPLFPTLLAMIGVFGIDPLNGARWLGVFLFGANILLVGLVINRYTHGFWTSVFGSFIMLSSVDMLNIHSMAWSEPVFIMFGLLGLFLLALHLENPRSLLLIASSGGIALAFLARYTGVAFVATGMAGVFLLGRKEPTVP